MSSVKRWFGLCGGLLLLAPPLFGRVPLISAEPLGVQECDTRCQTHETDCDLACDQVAACVEECKKASEICAQKCREAPPPPSASASGKPAPNGSAKAPGPKAPAGKAPGPKAPAGKAPAPAKPAPKP